MAKEGGEEESKGLQPETNAPSMGNSKKSGSTGSPTGEGNNARQGKSSNFKSHDEHLHKMMPNGYKGDCGY